MARPRNYNAATAKKICERIADGESLRSICQESKMPSRETVRKWIIRGEGVTEDEAAGFAGQYARAKIASAESFEDRIMQNCDKLESDQLSMPQATARRSATDILFRLAAIRAPKTHGDLQKLEHTGTGGESLKVVIEMPEDKSKQ